MKQQQNRNQSILYLFILACAIALIFWIFRSTPTSNVTNIPISQVVTMSQDNEIKSINVSGQNLSIVGTNGTQYLSYLSSSVTIYQVTGLNLNPPVAVTFQTPGTDWGSIVIDILGIVAIAALVYFMFIQSRRANNQVMNFGRSNARRFPVDKPQVTFNDVAGVDEAKQELREVVDFLKIA